MCRHFVNSSSENLFLKVYSRYGAESSQRPLMRVSEGAILSDFGIGGELAAA
jgi:hypothetical protein